MIFSDFKVDQNSKDKITTREKDFPTTHVTDYARIVTIPELILFV